MALAGVDRAEASRIIATLPQSHTPEPEPVEIMSSLQPVIQLIIACQRHIRVVPVGMFGSQIVGFDLQMIEQAAKWRGIRIKRRMAEDIGVLEAEMVRLSREAQPS